MDNALKLPRGLPHITRAEQRDAQELAALLEIGRTLADLPHLKRAMGRALELLGHDQAFSRCFVLLPDPETGELRVEASYGMDEEEARRVSYRPGEGVVW